MGNLHNNTNENNLEKIWKIHLGGQKNESNFMDYCPGVQEVSD